MSCLAYFVDDDDGVVVSVVVVAVVVLFGACTEDPGGERGCSQSLFWEYRCLILFGLSLLARSGCLDPRTSCTPMR